MNTPDHSWDPTSTMPAISRRQVLQGAVGIGAAAALATSAIRATGRGVATAEGIAESGNIEAAPSSTEAALARLKEGNERFIAGRPQFTHTSRQWRDQLTKSQHPFATVICCSDSRVPPELIFDCGFGDLFSIRIAGNIISEDVLGSLQYASYHLKTPLFLVLGHESCGAVTAAVKALLGQDNEPEHIRSLIDMITPGLTTLDRNLPASQMIEQAVVANVVWSQQQILRLPAASRALEENRHQLRGAVYSLETGRVRFL